MKILDPGHLYLAESVGNIDPIRIQFVKNRGAKYPGNIGDPQQGIICQELLRILIDRTAYLNNQGSCAETEHALANLRSALGWYESRAARCREEFIDLPHADSLEREPVCGSCGHNCCGRDVHERLPGTWR